MWIDLLVIGFVVGFAVVWLFFSQQRKHRDEVVGLFSQLLQNPANDASWFALAILGENKIGNYAANAVLQTTGDVVRVAAMLHRSLERNRRIALQCEGGLRFGDTHSVAIPLLRLILAMVEYGQDTSVRRSFVDQVLCGSQVGHDVDHRNNTNSEWRNHAFRVLIAADMFCVAAFQGFVDAADERTVLMAIPFFSAHGEKAQPYLNAIANSTRFSPEIRARAFSSLTSAEMASLTE